ncbi:hypothetical protein BDQ17DRAFT_1248319 [Cyathus striatus]|nr:hypothetical protein BDQ17DRAFT_1248319 [Cyathus striatus]
MSPTRPKWLLGVERTNYVSRIQHNSTLNGAWLIDPSIWMPSTLLAKLKPEESEETRRNLWLSTSNAPLTADVAILPPHGEEPVIAGKDVRPVTYAQLEVSSIKRDMDLLMPRPVVRLDLTSKGGSVNLALPRSFRGWVILHQGQAKLTLSPAIESALNFLTTEGDHHRAFLGDWKDIPEQQLRYWDGDEARLTASIGEIYVKFEDERSIN